MRYLILIVFFLASCSTYKRAYNKAYKSHKINKLGFLKASLELYSPKDSVFKETTYIKGDTIYAKGDTILVDCKDKKIKVPCPPSFHRLDTMYINTTKTVTDTRHEQLNITLKEKLAIVETRLVEKGKSLRSSLLVISILVGYLVFRNIARFKLPLIYKFLP